MRSLIILNFAAFFAFATAFASEEFDHYFAKNNKGFFVDTVNFGAILSKNCSPEI